MYLLMIPAPGSDSEERLINPRNKHSLDYTGKQAMSSLKLFTAMAYKQVNGTESLTSFNSHRRQQQCG